MSNNDFIINFNKLYFWRIISFNSNQFNVKYQCGIWWNDSPSSFGTISIIRWTGEQSSLSNTHLSDTFIPSFDHLPETQIEFKWFVSVSWRIEFFSIKKSSCVMNNNFISFFWEVDSITIFKSFYLNTHLKIFK